MIVAGDGIIIVIVSFVGGALIVEGEVIRPNTVAPRARKVDSLVPKTSLVIRKRDFKAASSIHD